MTFLDYTPSHVAPEQLAAITVGAHHRAVIASLIASVRDNLDRATPPHQLLVGPRGAGKSHALALFVHALRTEPDVSKRTLPLWLPEEEPYPRHADLFVEAIGTLARVLPDLGAAPDGLAPLLRRTVEALPRERDDDRALDTAFSTLEDAGRRLGRRLVVVAENLQVTFDAAEGGGRAAWKPEWHLRALLQKAKHVQVVGAAATLFGATLEPDAPFYQFFAQHTLSELTPDEVVELFRVRVAWEARHAKDAARLRRAQVLQSGEKETEARLRGLVTLTGGLPRMAQQLFEILMWPDARTLEEDLRRFLDQQSPYFQGRLLSGAVPAAELRVLDAIVDAEGPATAGELARSLNEDARKVTVYLKRLLQASHVRTRPALAGARGERWDVSEPLYRVWRRFRRGRDARLQLVLLAEFVAALVPARELMADREMLLRGGIGRTQMALLDLAIERHPALHPPTGATRGTPDKQGNARAFRAAWRKADEIFARGQYRDAREEYERAVHLARRSEDRLRVLCCLGETCRITGELDDAMRHCMEGEKLAVELGDEKSHASITLCIGEVFLLSGRSDDSLAAVDRAGEMFLSVGEQVGRAACVQVRGDILASLSRSEESLAAYGEAERIFAAADCETGRATCICGMANVFFALGRNEEAMAAFEDAENRSGEQGINYIRAHCLEGRAKILFRLGRGDEGLVVLGEAEEMFVANGHIQGRARCEQFRGEHALDCGRLLDALHGLEKARESYRAAGSFDGRAHASRCLLALALIGVGIERSMEHINEACVGYSLARVAGQAVAWIARGIAWAMFRGGVLPEAVLDRWTNFAAEHESEPYTHDSFASGAAMLLTFAPDRRATLARIRDHATPTLAALLRPLDLAIAVQDGRLPADLPAEPEEVRRAVQAALAALPPTKKPSKPRRRSK